MSRYLAFVTLLRRDGYVVRGSSAALTAETLASSDVLVISNALNERNLDDWSLPTPSAFTGEEITAVREWVHAGGALMLIADHMPMPGAAESLAAVFGVEFLNGFAFESTTDTDGPMIFRRRFTEDTQMTRVGGWSQGAVLEFGEGRVALFGEAVIRGRLRSRGRPFRSEETKDPVPAYL